MVFLPVVIKFIYIWKEIKKKIDQLIFVKNKIIEKVAHSAFNWFGISWLTIQIVQKSNIF